jgi:acetylornithine deacetylase/succinyl-diaminopimelate desuccinylase-like protein
MSRAACLAALALLGCGPAAGAAEPDWRAASAQAAAEPDWDTARQRAAAEPDWRTARDRAAAEPDWRTARDRAAAEPDWRTARDRAAALLSDLIRIDTSNPPGNERPAARLLAEWLEAAGIPAGLHEPAPGRASLIARLPATAPRPGAGGPILLLSHLDVVPAEPDEWSVPPFAGVIEGGFVHGRGALDDKGHAAIFAVALALLERSGAPRSRDLVLCAAADEESGGALGVAWLVEERWAELGPPAVVWNEGGAAARLASLGEVTVNGIATTEKRALWLRLHAEGEGGHGSQPIPPLDGKPGAATDVLVAALARLAAEETPLRVTRTAAEFLARIAPATSLPNRLALRHLDHPLARWWIGPTLARHRFTNALVRDTVALTGLQAGLEVNQIPGRAEATLDARLLPDSDAATFLAWLGAALGDPRVQVESMLGEPPAPGEASPWDHELFRALEAELARELPGSVTAPLQSTGATDSALFRARGVPAYGFVPALYSDELNATVHGADERMPLEELERAVRVTWRVLARLVR